MSKSLLVDRFQETMTQALCPSIQQSDFTTQTQALCYEFD